jgi:replicative DNA helicase
MHRSDQDGDAKVTDLIAQFKAAQSQLFGLVDEYETERFRSLERTVEQTFVEIEQRVPRDAGEFRAIAQFYLDMLEDNDGGYNGRLHACLRQLVDRHAFDVSSKFD